MSALLPIQTAESPVICKPFYEPTHSCADAGRYAAEIGASSRDIKGKVVFALTGDYTESD